MSKKLPIVSIVGRQNVGKSTLFNALIKEKKAIVDSFPGLTRDIISYKVNHNSISFILSDTPGLDISDSSKLTRSIIENTYRHLEQSSVIIFLLEKPSPDSFDIDLKDIIRKLSLPTIIAVNKMDNKEDLENMINFYEMGFNDIVPISALRMVNITLFLNKIIDILPQKILCNDKIDLNIALVGRPNSGKSTLLNSLIGHERAVVSDIPGTTRDAVDDEFTFLSKRIRIIDTAGLIRKRRIKGNVQFYSMRRAIDSIKKSDVVFHLIDATIGLTETDKKISDEIIKSNKPLIITINKWDAIEKDDKTFNEYKDKIIFKYYRAVDFPIISISAIDKMRIHKLIKTALGLNEKSKIKIPTPELNKVFEVIQKKNAIPLLGKTMKIYYATQTDSTPTKFKIFVNKPELFKKDVIRFLEKTLQERFDLKGIPIVIDIEGRKREQ